MGNVHIFKDIYSRLASISCLIMSFNSLENILICESVKSMLIKYSFLRALLKTCSIAEKKASDTSEPVPKMNFKSLVLY